MVGLLRGLPFRAGIQRLGGRCQNILLWLSASHLTLLEHHLTSCDKSASAKLAAMPSSLSPQERADIFGHAEHHSNHLKSLRILCEPSQAKATIKPSSWLGLAYFGPAWPGPQPGPTCTALLLQVTHIGHHSSHYRIIFSMPTIQCLTLLN
jgi:hypothetical protein